MRVLVLIVAVLAALYGGYWLVGSRAVQTGAVAALEGLEAEGWLVEYEDLSTRGFPSRFDTTVSGLTLASPDRALTWETEFVQVLALSYRPNRLIAVWAPSQRLTVDGVPVSLLSRLPIRASLRAGLERDLPLRDARLESGEVILRIGDDVSVAARGVIAGVREAAAGPGTYDIFLEIEGLGPPGDAALLDVVRLEAQATLDAPLDRRLQGPPVLRSLTLGDVRIAKGDLALTVEGALAPDAEGYLAGDLSIVAEDWRGLLALAREAGWVDEGRGAVFARALEGAAQGEERIEVPIAFADGRVTAMGLPLGVAPLVAQRQ